MPILNRDDPNSLFLQDSTSDTSSETQFTTDLNSDIDIPFEFSEKNESEKLAFEILSAPSDLQNCNIIQTCLRDFFNRKFFEEGLFFSQWDHKDMIYQLTQELDGSIHTCLYIAANAQGIHFPFTSSKGNQNDGFPHLSKSGRTSKLFKGRTQCEVGFCKNPKSWIESKNHRQRRSYAHRQRHTTDNGIDFSDTNNLRDVSFKVNSPQLVNTQLQSSGVQKMRGWCMLCYVVLERKKYGDKVLNKIGEQISKIKGMESRIQALLKFAIARQEPFRISKRLFNRKDSWYMPNVQLYMSKNPVFKAHIQSMYTTSSDISDDSDISEPSEVDVDSMDVG